MSYSSSDEEEEEEEDGAKVLVLSKNTAPKRCTLSPFLTFKSEKALRDDNDAGSA